MDTEISFRYILTVSELTREIKDVIETGFCEVWVEGEISNLHVPPSGHHYLTLKDEWSQIRAVIFRNQACSLRFVPEDGLHVICRGRVGVYERKGEYQLIIEYMEPKGIGALQLAFLQLKERLQKEGLFDPSRKKPIPMVPRKIGIVTSPTGAVINDMLKIIRRRFENVHILIYPVRVQGDGAALEIAEAITYLGEQTDAEVIIVGRGGGSIEDLQPFNEEIVARAISHCNVPVVSAVGHETDYTICDFVSDLRAPTPSAAAELVVRDKRELKATIDSLRLRLVNQIQRSIENKSTRLLVFEKMLRDPRAIIRAHTEKIDKLVDRISMLAALGLKRGKERCAYLEASLRKCHPGLRIRQSQQIVMHSRKRLVQGICRLLEVKRERLNGIAGRLDSLSPLAILKRGYSIVRKGTTKEILRDAADVNEGDRVEIILHLGRIWCDVIKRKLGIPGRS